MDEKLHIIPDDMVFLLMLLEAVFLAIKDIPLDTTDEAGAVLVFLNALFLLTNLGELVDDDSSNNLIHDDLYDEEVAEVNQHIPKRNSGVVIGKVVSVI